MIKYSVLTFIFGDYECLHDVLDINPNIEYICVTDNKRIKSNTWKIVYDDIDPNFTSFRKVIEVRYNPFKYVHSDICLILDGSIQIKKFPYLLLNKFVSENYDFCALSHASRYSILDELAAWEDLRQYPKFYTNTIKEFLKNINYDTSYKGLYQVGLQIVKNTKVYNDFRTKCLKFITTLAKKNDAFRIDQIIYSLIMNKFYDNSKFLVLSQKELCGNYFLIYSHNSNTKPVSLSIDLRDIDYTYALNDRVEAYYIDNCVKKLITIGICNFNTTKLTNACIGSILKCVKKHPIYKIIILDNSTNEKFILDDKYKNKNVSIIDNTAEKYVNFKSIVIKHGGSTINNYANLKHTASVQFLLNICTTKYFILFDSDTLLKKDIDFVDDNVITSADIQDSYTTNADTGNNVLRYARFIPFIQYFNIALIKRFNLHYLNFRKIVGTKYKNSEQYDTGCSFTVDIVNNNYRYNTINHHVYVEHLLGSSWAKVHNENKFLTKFENLYR